MASNLGSRNIAEIKALAATLNSRRHFVRLGGAQDELHMRRRLLHGLQERIERRRGQHVHFVDDVNLVSAASRCNARAGDQITRIVNAAVGSAVNFHHIHVIATHDGFANFRRLRLAARIQRSRKDARHTGLTNAARSTEEIRMRSTPGSNGVLQGATNGVLPHYFCKRARAVPARQDRIRLGGLAFETRDELLHRTVR